MRSVLLALAVLACLAAPASAAPPPLAPMGAGAEHSGCVDPPGFAPACAHPGDLCGQLPGCE